MYIGYTQVENFETHVLLHLVYMVDGVFSSFILTFELPKWLCYIIALQVFEGGL